MHRHSHRIRHTVQAFSSDAPLQIDDVTIDGHRQNITLRTYRPRARKPTPLPAVLYFHGGGFVGGSIDDAHQPASLLAQRLPAFVVAVGYSLAPAFPFPAAVEDAYLAFEWTAAYARMLRIDPCRIAAVGHDAGGNVAAALAAIARDRGTYKLAAEALLGPLLDPSLTRLTDAPASNAALRAQRCARHYRAYLPHAAQRMHPYAAPLESCRLHALPPTLIASAEHDALRADGEAYAKELISAGVPVQVTRHAGIAHDDLITHAPVLDDVTAFLRRHFDPAP
ncbi:alpha/beta hydrolase [Paraburkholderia solisilvae]|uniref:Carboxylesterase NlhH n=1 Tax=Paraburkholderia solisilvae TaxID=624376 RepID=A0A6J5DE42_9BURK|nr:alpha/beta hydrolase [Paraburkholderia solisilvae]CAB3751086.1 Carboxylesterase NlhH [Paraburkholderia solisilvae]